MESFLTGLLIAVGVSAIAYRAQALNLSGAIAAAILGTIVFGLGGVGWAFIMITFFISSSGLSKLFAVRKESSGLNFSKGSRRDAWQVAANGGMAGLLVLIDVILSRFSPGNTWSQFLWIGFAGSLAAANADTWATELGLLNPSKPVLVSTLQKVPWGTSGAVSPVGILASLSGSALIGGAAVLSLSAGWRPSQGIGSGAQFLIITFSGMVGSLVDSILGATIQSVYYCPICEKETEQHPRHHCGALTNQKRGLSWINNDWVNAACTITAGITGLLLVVLLN